MLASSLVKEARRRAGLTQSELASRLGVPQSTIGRWETSVIAPSFDNVVRAIRACDLELSVRLVPQDPQLAWLIDEYARMTPAQRFAQNIYLVDFVDRARRRVTARA